MSDIRCVLLKQSVENDLISACRSRLPYETCGIIYGSTDNATVSAEGFAVVRNISANPSHSFFFGPQQWIALYYEAQKNQREIVGFFHSHPSGSVLPSNKDTRAWTPWRTYWIVSFVEGAASIAAYRMDGIRQWVSLPIQRDC